MQNGYGNVKDPRPFVQCVPPSVTAMGEEANQTKLCVDSVSGPGGWGVSPCGNKAKYGDYCGIHSPEQQAKRAKKRGPTQFEKDWMRRDKERKRVSDMETELARLRKVEEALIELGGVACIGFYKGSDEKLDYTASGEHVPNGNMVVVVNADDFNSWVKLCRTALGDIDAALAAKGLEKDES